MNALDRMSSEERVALDESIRNFIAIMPKEELGRAQDALMIWLSEDDASAEVLGNTEK